MVYLVMIYVDSRGEHIRSSFGTIEFFRTVENNGHPCYLIHRKLEALTEWFIKQHFRLRYCPCNILRLENQELKK